MCDPTAILGAQIAGTALNTVGSYFSASMQKSALKSQARIAEINATLSFAAARAELGASERQQNMIKLRGARVKSSQKAAYAANGIDIGVGSPVNVATSTDYITAIDANTAEANGIQAAWGRRIEAHNFQAQARSMRAQASGINPLASAVGTLLGSGAQVAQSWYKMDQAGAFSDAPTAAATGGTTLSEGDMFGAVDVDVGDGQSIKVQW